MATLDAHFGLFDVSPILLNSATGGAGRDFANAVALVESALDPAAMLAAVKTIEREFGRRGARRWAARVLDLDLIAWSGGRVRTRDLTIPHPAATGRSFVIAPLAAIAPDWRLDGPRTARQLAARLGKGRPTR